ncbi:hypothetical protein JTB14_023120 [Gonioctena quinquepunctata]|nr:hypothetical protein JTB14_023120 [Gonioctena quinquepunctata]
MNGQFRPFADGIKKQELLYHLGSQTQNTGSGFEIMPSFTPSGERSFMSTDPLSFLISKIRFKPERWFMFKIFLWFVIVYVEIFNAFIIFNGFDEKDNDFAKIFLIVVLIQQVGIAGSWVAMSYYHIILNISKNIHEYSWTWSMARKELCEDIEKECRWLRIAFILIQVFLCVFAIFIMDFLHQLLYSGTSWAGVMFLVLYYLACTIFEIPIAGILWVVIYITFHWKYQFALLTDYVETELSGEGRRHKEFNQDLIYKNLKNCIQQHIRIKK